MGIYWHSHIAISRKYTRPPKRPGPPSSKTLSRSVNWENSCNRREESPSRITLRDQDRESAMLSLSSQFRRWFEYERDSHAKAFSSLAAVPEGLRSSNAFEQAATLLAHISAARQLWLHRLGVEPEIPREFFPKVDSLADLETRLKA